jgi:hypothetical protein
MVMLLICSFLGATPSTRFDCHCTRRHVPSRNMYVRHTWLRHHRGATISLPFLHTRQQKHIMCIEEGSDLIRCKHTNGSSLFYFGKHITLLPMFVDDARSKDLADILIEEFSSCNSDGLRTSGQRNRPSCS